MKRVKIGDVVEIPTKRGLFYAQYTHKHQQYGALLRIFGENYSTRPAEFAEIVRNRPVFMTFFPLGVTVSRGIFSIVANVDLPEDSRPFPTFRAGIADPATGKVRVWWLWDGQREWRVDELTLDQRSFSILGVCNAAFLIKRIESGWTPETDPQ
jgi:hypothetical protein